MIVRSLSGYSVFDYPYSEKEMTEVSKIILSRSDATSIKFSMDREYIITKKGDDPVTLYSKLMLLSCGDEEWQNVIDRLEEILVTNIDSEYLIKYLEIVDDCGEFLKHAIHENYQKLEPIFIHRHLTYDTAKTWYLKHETKIKLKGHVIDALNKIDLEGREELFQYIASILNIKFENNKLIYKSSSIKTEQYIDKLNSLLETGSMIEFIIDRFNKYS